MIDHGSPCPRRPAAFRHKKREIPRADRYRRPQCPGPAGRSAISAMRNIDVSILNFLLRYCVRNVADMGRLRTKWTNNSWISPRKVLRVSIAGCHDATVSAGQCSSRARSPAFPAVAGERCCAPASGSLSVVLTRYRSADPREISRPGTFAELLREGINMADTTRIDVEAVRHKADKLRAIHGEYVSLVATLRDTLQRHEKCWGSDKFGQAFEKGYLGNLTAYNGNADVVENNLEATAGNIDSAVTSLQQQDEANATTLS